MLRRLRTRLTYANIVATMALFFALAGGTAVALDGSNTVFGDDIVDNEVSSADVRNDNLGFGGLAAQDLGPNSVGTSEVASSSLNGSDIVDGSLFGSDIVESSLNMPPTTTAHFVGPSGVAFLASNGSMTHITGANLPPGDYAAVATANFLEHDSNSDHVVHHACELRGPDNNFIGGAEDRRPVPADTDIRTSLSMNGGAHNSSSSTGISLWCSTDIGSAELRRVQSAQIMITRLDGFF